MSKRNKKHFAPYEVSPRPVRDSPRSARRHRGVDIPLRHQIRLGVPRLIAPEQGRTLHVLLSEPRVAGLLGNTGGRPRIYDYVQELAAKETVSAWLRGLEEGPGRKTAGYHLARFIRRRMLKELEADPDGIIEACVNGTSKTLIENLKFL